MKKGISIFIVILFFSLIVFAQEKEDKKTAGKNKYSLESKSLVDRGKELDSQIEELCTKIGKLIKTYNLMKVKNIKIDQVPIRR